MTVKFLLSFLLSFRYIPHIVLFIVEKNRFSDDVKVGTLHHIGKEIDGVGGLVYLLTFSPMFRNLFYHRVGVLSHLFSWMCKPYESFYIDSHVEICGGMNCIHPFSTVINAKRIGKNFTVKNNVTIGDNKPNEKPVIGNNVIVNANSVVFGNIIIGDNVVIGAGTVVNKNIPSNCVVVGNPARIIRKEGLRINLAL